MLPQEILDFTNLRNAILGHFGRKFCTVIDAVITTFQGNFLSDPPLQTIFFWLAPPFKANFFCMPPLYLIKNERSLMHQSQLIFIPANLIDSYLQMISVGIQTANRLPETPPNRRESPGRQREELKKPVRRLVGIRMGGSVIISL